jgi:hypothetical protein
MNLDSKVGLPQHPDADERWWQMARESAALQPFMERMQPVILEAVARLANTTFRLDPIGGPKYSRATSIISSAYKRHGQILGRALLERLKDCAHFTTWTEDSFKLSPQSAIELKRKLPPEALLTRHLPYGDHEQSIPIDVLVFDTQRKTLRSYNVKRGNGAYDAGKRRLIFDELQRTQMHLKGYAESVGCSADVCEAKIVFYYGLRSIPEPYSLVSDDLDCHFNFPVRDALELVNDTFRSKLYEVIESGA